MLQALIKIGGPQLDEVFLHLRDVLENDRDTRSKVPFPYCEKFFNIFYKLQNNDMPGVHDDEKKEEDQGRQLKSEKQMQDELADSKKRTFLINELKEFVALKKPHQTGLRTISPSPVINEEKEGPCAPFWRAFMKKSDHVLSSDGSLKVARAP